MALVHGGTDIGANDLPDEAEQVGGVARAVSRGVVVRVVVLHSPAADADVVPRQADRGVPWHVARTADQRLAAHDSPDSEVPIEALAQQVIDLDRRVVPEQRVAVPIVVRTHMVTTPDHIAAHGVLAAVALVAAQVHTVAPDRADTTADLFTAAASKVDGEVC